MALALCLKIPKEEMLGVIGISILIFILGEVRKIDRAASFIH